MKSHAGHFQINVNPVNLPFYKDLMNFLGWKMVYEDPTTYGVEDELGVSLWYTNPLKEGGTDYDRCGMNHVGISVPAQADVDAAVAYLKEHGIPALFDTPRHRPEFAMNEEYTYYQVMFESPDHILFEIVYMGPLQKT